jgi:pimeloyl-ACP methyl ester carboxylesterase
MPFLALKGQQIFFAFREGQNASKCSLLLIHGAGGSHLDWPPELRNMNSADVYAMDLPGHGRSEPPGCSSISDYAEFVRAFIESIDVAKIILIGHSMGGAIVQQIGLDPPAPVLGLVLVASGARLRVAPEILEGVIPEFEKTADLIAEVAWSETTPDRLKQVGKRMLLTCDPTTVYGDYVACNDFDLMNDLQELRLPTLVVCGTEDRLTPMKYGRFLAEQLPNARMETIAGAGHMVMLEQPAAVATSIEVFAKSLTGS